MIFSPLIAKIAGGLSLVLAIALGFALWSAEKADRRADDLQEHLTAAQAAIASLTLDAALKERAAAERANDTARIAEAEKDILDAINQIPDEAPGAVGIAAGCQRLRASGAYLDADLPAVCRSGS